MRKYILLLSMVVIMTVGLTSCTNADTAVAVKESLLKSGSGDLNYIELTKLNDNVWVHTSYSDYQGSRTPSNGLVVITSKGLVLIDTPWNNSQTKELIQLTKDTFKKDFILGLITHAHADRIGGIDTLLENKVDVRSTGLTAIEAERNGFKKPQVRLDAESDIKAGNTAFETFYPGAGHSVDNITVWLPEYKILYGGCLIKSEDATDIGNTADADIKQWPVSVKKVLDKYPDAKIVVPGHGKWGTTNLIKHTLELLEKK